jgi:hypothetical protein
VREFNAATRAINRLQFRRSFGGTRLGEADPAVLLNSHLHYLIVSVAKVSPGQPYAWRTISSS